jgi:enoyl-CoA hydratase/carnithine racemase
VSTAAKRAGSSAEPAASEAVLTSAPEAGIALLTLNKAASRNALSRAMITALDDALRAAERDPAVKVIVLTALGPAFSSGHDLKELAAHRGDADGGKAFYVETMQACSALMQSIVMSPRPVIAAVQGIATAAGCQLVASCDLAVASSEAKFATPGVNIGLFCSTPMVALSRNVSRKRAMEMLLLGDMLSAEAAADYGLVNRVAAPEAVLPEALAMARQIAAKSSVTVTIGKQAFYHQLEQPLSEAYDYASKVMVENMMTADAEEGIAAFIEKRSPVWKGC